MKKYRIYILLSILTAIFLFGTAAICNQCTSRFDELLTEAEAAEEIEEAVQGEAIEEPEEEIVEEDEELVYRIVFYSDHEPPTAIYSCMSDGSDIQLVYSSGFGEMDPCWNAQHTQIVFLSSMEGDKYGDPFIYDIASGEILRLIEREGPEFFPYFSPDGKSVVFAGGIVFPNEEAEDEIKADWQIFTVNIDGSNLKQLTEGYAFSWYPHYSPDGDTIIFSSNVDGHDKLFTMDTEGNNIVQLTIGGLWHDKDGCFSPDGKKIVFESDRSGKEDIWVMPVDNPEAAVNLTDNPARDTSPDWSPDGSMIVFISDRDAEEYVFDIFTMDQNGQNQTNITPGLTDSFQGLPNW